MSLFERSKRSSPLRTVVRPLTLALVATLFLAACGGPGTPPEGPPTAPSDVTAVAGPGYVTVGWTDNSDNETGFEIYRSVPAPASGASAHLAPLQDEGPLATVPANSTSFIDLEVELQTPYDYQVVAVGAEGSSAVVAAPAAANVQPGVDLLVGTVNRVYDDDATGTTFLVYTVFSEEFLASLQTDMSMSISGPVGWNDDQPVEFAVISQSSNLETGFFRFAMQEIDAVAGTYTLTAEIDGETYQGTSTVVDASYRLGRPSDIDVSASEDGSSVSATWTPPPDAVTVYASIHEANWAGTLFRSAAQGPEHTFSGLALADGQYLFDVMSLNVDLLGYPVKVAQYGQSGMYAPFGIGDPQSSLCDSPEQVIEFPDAALRQAVRDSLYRPSGDFKCIDLMLLEWVDADAAGVTNLEGLQYADNLKWVDLAGNDGLTSIEQLSGLENLLSVILWGSQIGDASPLAGKTAIEYIDLGGTKVTDSSFLEGMTNLETLHLWGLNGIDFTPIHELTQLTSMSLSSTGLTDATAGFLADLTELADLWIDDNQLTSLAPLVANTGIGQGDEVWVRYNYLDLEDATVLADIETLEDRGVILHYQDQVEPPQ